MKAYLIETTQECQKLTCMGFSDPKTVKVADVRAIYIPGELMLGYDLGERRTIHEHKPPFLGAQEIVDGKMKGVVKEIDLDNPTFAKVLSVSCPIGSYDAVKTIVDYLYL